MSRAAALRRPVGVIAWLLGLQVAIAALLVGGDFLEIAARMSRDSAAPPADTPVRPGDQTRRYDPRTLPRDPVRFPHEEVPSRLRWQTIDGTAELLLTGEIVAGDGARFIAYLDGLAAPLDTVSLHSPGGVVSDALEIGRRLRADGIATRVGADAACFSACPYVLAGGVERIVSRSAAVGVHQSYFEENVVLPAFLAVDDIQRGQAEVMEYLSELGIDPLLMIEIMKTPPEEIYILLDEELTRFALATELVD